MERVSVCVCIHDSNTTAAGNVRAVRPNCRAKRRVNVAHARAPLKKLRRHPTVAKSGGNGVVVVVVVVVYRARRRHPRTTRFVRVSHAAPPHALAGRAAHSRLSLPCPSRRAVFADPLSSGERRPPISYEARFFVRAKIRRYIFYFLPTGTFIPNGKKKYAKIILLTKNPQTTLLIGDKLVARILRIKNFKWLRYFRKSFARPGSCRNRR